MKSSELRAQLEAIEKEHGDLPVCIDDGKSIVALINKVSWQHILWKQEKIDGVDFIKGDDMVVIEIA